MNVEEAVEDLCCRFVLNAPEEELASVGRVMFLVEEAHWFYCDFYAAETGTPLDLRAFTARVFARCPNLRAHVGSVADVVRDFEKTKRLVPVCGAALLTPRMDKVLLVNSWDRRAWGFPKGKINKGEADAACALREVREETGFDAAPLLAERDFIELTALDRRCRIYVVAGVPEDTPFAPATRKEIAGFAWVPLAALHATAAALPSGGRVTHTALAFVPRLKAWIAGKKQQQQQQPPPPPSQQPRRRVAVRKQQQQQQQPSKQQQQPFEELQPRMELDFALPRRPEDYLPPFPRTAVSFAAIRVASLL